MADDWDEIGPLNQKVHAFRARFMEYELITSIKEDLRMLVERDNTASEGGVMTLIGRSGSGKTQLIEDFMRGYPRIRHAIRHADGRVADRVTVVVVPVPDTGVKTLGEALYEELTQAEAPKERRFDIQKSIYHYTSEMQTKLVIFEESHEATADETNKTVKAVARLFKQFSNKATFSVLIVGTDEARRLVEVNSELKRRNLGSHNLLPFAWDDPESRRVFLRLLGRWDKLLQDVFQPSGLNDPALAAKIYRSSGGLVGLAAILVERAALTAVRDKVRKGTSCIMEAHLHSAHKLLDRGEPNPFSREPAQEGVPGIQGIDREAGTVGNADEEPRAATGRGARRAGRDRNFRP